MQATGSTGLEAVLLVVQVGGDGLGADVLVGAQGGLVAGGHAQGSHVFPGVLLLRRRGPEGKLQAQEVAENKGVRLVKSADSDETLQGGRVGAEAQVHVAERAAEFVEIVGRQAVGAVRAFRAPAADIEDMAQIDERVSRHGEGELRLADGFCPRVW